jgi:hypothetical protein
MFSASENSLPLVEANKKGGRPRKRATERKTKTVCVHFSDLEYYVVKSRSKNANLKPGNFCRAMILNSHVVAALNKEETELLRNICAIGNNLNQLAHSANLTGTLSLEKEIRDVLNLFKKLNKQIFK